MDNKEIARKETNTEQRASLNNTQEFEAPETQGKRLVPLSDLMHSLKFFLSLANIENPLNRDSFTDFIRRSNNADLPYIAQGVEAQQKAIEKLADSGITSEFIKEQLFIGSAFDITEFALFDEATPDYVPLLEHDLRNVVGDIFQIWSLIENYQDPGFIDQFNLEEATERAIRLCKIIEEGLRNDEMLGNIKLSDLLDTLNLYNSDLNKSILNNTDNFNINTLEEFITLRTLIDNAAKALRNSISDGSIQGEPELIIQMDIEENGTRTFLIGDNARNSMRKGNKVEWLKQQKAELAKVYKDGESNPYTRYKESHGGLSISAYRAGQRGDPFSLFEKKRKGKDFKYISVGFSPSMPSQPQDNPSTA